MQRASVTSYHSRIYRDFRAIEPSEHRKQVRFYEKFEPLILRLDFDEYFDLLLQYTNALFEIGAYQKHLLMADTVIETSILQNISAVRGEEIYCATLFKKAGSYFNLHEYQKAEHILCELLKINPDDVFSKMFLEKCLRAQRPQQFRNVRAVAIFLLMMTALTTLVQLLFVRHFYPFYERMVAVARNTEFAMACLVLIGGFLWHHWSARHDVRVFIKETKSEKDKKI